MDLNYLLQRHQIALMLADAAGSQEARSAHRGLARGYADAIARLQGALNAPMLAVQPA